MDAQTAALLRRIDIALHRIDLARAQIGDLTQRVAPSLVPLPTPAKTDTLAGPVREAIAALDELIAQQRSGQGHD